MDPNVLRRYRDERAKGVPAGSALRFARWVTTPPAPTYPFLAKLDIDTNVTGTVGPFTVTVRVQPDEDSRLGEDDVTGWFTDRREDGCVKNTLFGPAFKWYRPSSYTLEHTYDDFRSMGMSKGVARDAVRERIQQEMYEDANRSYWGVSVTISVDTHELAYDSLWGIDSIPGYDVVPHLIEVTEGMIGGAIGEAREAIPAALGEAETGLAQLRAAASWNDSEWKSE